MVWFMPKEEDFFERFESAARNAHEGAVLVVEFVEKFDDIVARAKRIKDIGQRIAELQPVHGFCAESAGAVCLHGATGLGIPVSTTHTITGAIVGVGATRGVRAVRWGVAGRVVWAWVLTIPLAALIAAGMLHIFGFMGWR